MGCLSVSACCGVQVNESGQPSAMPTQVALVCPRQQAPAPGQEITIDYGDKSNEQLLLNYGECIVPALPCPALPCPALCSIWILQHMQPFGLLLLSALLSSVLLM